MCAASYKTLDEDGIGHTEDHLHRIPHQKEHITTWFVYILTLSSTISGFLMGYDIGVVSGSMLLIVPYFHLNTIWTEAIVSATVGSAAIFALTSGYMADVFGRRKIILFSSVAFGVGSIVMGSSPTKEVLLVGRIIVGIGIGYSITTVGVYIAESAPAHNRGRLVTLNQLFITIGIFVSSVIVGAFSEIKDTGWRYMVALPSVAAIIQFIAFLFLPESSRWLVGQGRDLEARAVLDKIRALPDPKELQDIQKSVEDDKLHAAERYVITKVCCTRHVRKALLVGCLLMGFQQMCGINTVIYYSATIMKMAGFSQKRAIWLVTVPNAVNFLSTFFGLWLVDKLGRRLLTLISISGVGIALCVLAIGFQLDSLDTLSVNVTETFNNGTVYNTSCAAYTNCDSCINDVNCGFCFVNVTSMASCLPVDKDQTGRSQFGRCSKANEAFDYDYGFCPKDFMLMSVLGMVLFVFSFAPGLGPMPVTINSEIYPLWARGTCVAIAQCVNWSSNLLVAFTFLTLTETITIYGTFWLYAGICVCGFISLFVFLPETKDKTLEQVETVFMSEAERQDRLSHDDAPNEQG